MPRSKSGHHQLELAFSHRIREENSKKIAEKTASLLLFFGGAESPEAQDFPGRRDVARCKFAGKTAELCANTPIGERAVAPVRSGNELF